MSSEIISVVMRTKNSDWVIAQALAGLFSQDFRNFELLVVDSGSTDRTLEIVNQYPHTLVQIKPEDYFPGKVLNDAMRATKSSIVVFQNSDTVPLAPNALGRLVAPFEDSAVAATMARQVPRPEAEPWVRRDYASCFPEEGDVPSWIPLSLPFSAIRRSRWEEHPFYTDAWASEDTEWGTWARREGHRVVYVPDSLVMHSHNYTLRENYGRRFVEGEADAFVLGNKPSAWECIGKGHTTSFVWHASRHCRRSSASRARHTRSCHCR